MGGIILPTRRGVLAGDTIAKLSSTFKAAGVTLSANNRRAVSAAVNARANVAAEATRTSGKYYYEATINNVTNGGLYIGFANQASLALTTDMETQASSVLVDNGGFVFIAGVNSASGLGTMAAAMVIHCAIDLTNNLVWFAMGGGTWNASGTANPATGVGGLSISGLTAGGKAPALGMWNASDVSVNFGQSAYNLAIPSGFVNWPKI
jgi:hypothetical protein